MRPLSEWEAYQRRLERADRLNRIVTYTAMGIAAVVFCLVLFLAYVTIVAVCGG